MVQGDVSLLCESNSNGNILCILQTLNWKNSFTGKIITEEKFSDEFEDLYSLVSKPSTQDEATSETIHLAGYIKSLAKPHNLHERRPLILVCSIPTQFKLTFQAKFLPDNTSIPTHKNHSESHDKTKETTQGFCFITF